MPTAEEMAQGSPLPVFTFGGKSWISTEMTGREVASLEKTIGLPYMMIRPVAYISHRIAVLSVFLLRDNSEEEVEKIIDGLTLQDLDEMLSTTMDDTLPTMYVDGLPDPNPEGEGSTST